MSDSAPNTSTALMIPETGAAIGRVVDDVINVAGRLLPDRKGKRPLSEGARRQIIRDHLVYSPSNTTAPFVAQVSFGGVPKRVGSTTSETDAKGQPFFDKDGNPTLGFVPDYDVAITGRAELPDPKDPSRRVSRDVQPLVLCDGRGTIVPYVLRDGEGVRAGKPMYCLFIRDFDMRTGQENGHIRAIPLGLADPANILRYNEVNARFAAQGSSKAGQEIEAIPNNLGRAVKFLELKPPGSPSPATQGLLPVWKRWDFGGLNPHKPDFWIVDRVVGKVATLDHKSQPVIIREGAVPKQIFRYEERWNSVELTTWGLPEEIVSMELHELEQGDFRVDWLALFGASLYTVTPWTGTTLVRQGLRRPPVDEMIAVGLLPPGSSEDLARQTIRGQGAKIVADVEATVTRALTDLVHNLGSGGRENPGLSLADVLGGEPSGELLAQAHDNAPTQDNLLVVALIASNTASELGLDEVWDPKCWVLEKAYKALLLELAQQAGIELPPPPAEEQADETASAPAESSDSGAEPPTNGSSTPAIVWRPDMGRNELYALARGLEGVNSKAIKAALVEALTAVCPPTPPA